MPKHPWQIWLAALALAWGFDLLFWQKPVGISFIIWIALCVIALIYLGVVEGARKATRTYLILAVGMALAAVTLVRTEPFTRFMGGWMALLALSMGVMTFSNGFWTRFRLVDYVVQSFWMLWAALSRPVELAGNTLEIEKEKAGGSGLKAVLRKAMPVLVGIGLALPVILIFGSLLASADIVFGDLMEQVVDLFRIERWFEYLFRIFYVLVFTYLFAGVLMHALHPKKEMEAPQTQQGWIKPFLGAASALIVLISVDVLFIVFVSIQFQYLFGGEANIRSIGYTYSEYARKGFGELVTVAILSLLIYLCLATITRMEKKGSKIAFSAASVTLLGLVMVMLWSALSRMLLYESAYGFTRLRAYTHVFIYCMGVLLLGTIVLEIIRRRGHFALLLLIASFGFVFALAGLNVDAYIARHNIERAHTVKDLDTHTLDMLSADAVPVLVNALDDEQMNQDDRDNLAAGLVCRALDYGLLEAPESIYADEESENEDTDVALESGREEVARQSAWPSWHPAEARARRMIGGVLADLQQYPMVRGDYDQILVDLPADDYHCGYQPWMD